MKLMEIWFYIWNIPYIEAFIMKDNRIVGKTVQKILSNKETEATAITFKKKYSWLILPNNCFYNKNKFVAFCDIENCIPLIEEKRVKTITSKYFITEKTITTLKEANIELIDYFTDKTGKNKIFKSAVIPPVTFHQIISAHFVKEALKNPPSKWEELKWAIIAVVIGLVVIAVTYLTSRPMAG